MLMDSVKTYFDIGVHTHRFYAYIHKITHTFYNGAVCTYGIYLQMYEYILQTYSVYFYSCTVRSISLVCTLL